MGRLGLRSLAPVAGSGLANLNMLCNTDAAQNGGVYEALQSFKLITSSSKGWYYAYTCCNLLDTYTAPAPRAVTPTMCVRYTEVDVFKLQSVRPVHASELPLCRGMSVLKGFSVSNYDGGASLPATLNYLTTNPKEINAWWVHIVHGTAMGLEPGREQGWTSQQRARCAPAGSTHTCAVPPVTLQGAPSQHRQTSICQSMNTIALVQGR